MSGAGQVFVYIGVIKKSIMSLLRSGTPFSHRSRFARTLPALIDLLKNLIELSFNLPPFQRSRCQSDAAVHGDFFTLSDARGAQC